MDTEISQAWTAAEDFLRGIVVALPRLAAGLVVIALFWAAAGVVRRVVRAALDRYGRSSGAARVVSRLSWWGVFVAGLLVGLSVAAPSLDAASLVQLLGISGLAIGFAFKDVLQNFLAGVLILLTEPFEIGDQIIVDGFEGTVVEVETRATLIRTYDGRRVVIPNGQLYTSAVTVNTAYPKRRSQFDIGIGYEDDVELARRLILEAIGETEGVLEDPAPDVWVVQLADSSVNLRARWWTEPQKSNVSAIQHEFVERVKEKFDATEGVDFPYPVQDVRITREDGPGAPSGDDSGGATGPAATDEPSAGDAPTSGPPGEPA